MTSFDQSNQNNTIHLDMRSTEYYPERSIMRDNEKIGNLLKDSNSTSTNPIEYSDGEFSHIAISSRGLECNEGNDNEYCNLVFKANKEVEELMKIEISKKTEELIRTMAKMEESFDDVIYRGFSYLNLDSNFWNQK